MKNFLKTYLPQPIYNILKFINQSKFLIWLRKRKLLLTVYWVNLSHQRQIKRIKKKSKIKVLFIANQLSVWKYNKLYTLFENSKRFQPIILVCPLPLLNDKYINQDVENTYNYFKNNGFRVLNAFNITLKRYLSIKKDLKPDLIFFSLPYLFTLPQYCIFHLKNYLTCYVQYGFNSTYLYKLIMNMPFHNLVWKNFYETNLHLEMAKKHADNKGKNVIVTGYPKIDLFLDKNYIPTSPWKIQESNNKRIIWAPHHTIFDKDSGLEYSGFIKYNQFFKNFITNNSDFQMAFKPHPLLKRKLIMHPDWGLDKTNEYFSFWENQPNTILCESDYTDLFLTSDAMIHSSGSFIAEYLFVNKPVAFNVSNPEILNRFNDFGKKVLDTYILTTCETEILGFFNEVKNGIDKNQALRQTIIDQYLQDTNNTLASQNIFNYLNDVFKN